MEFLLEFKAGGVHDVTGTDLTRVGSDLVAQIRSEGNCPDLPLDSIKGWAIGLTLPCVPVILEEDYAAKAEVFNDTDRISVTVPESGLRKFFYLKAFLQHNSLNGKIVSACAEWVLNEDALLDAWEKAGFPMEWNTED